MWTLRLDQIETVLYVRAPSHSLLPLRFLKQLKLSQYYFIGEICYIAAIATTKISILFLLLRLFPKKSFRFLVYATMAFCGATGISFVFATAFQCNPVPYSWQQLDATKKGTCNNINLQAWVNAGLNISQDIIVLALPLRDLYGLKINLRKKIMVMSMFCVGIL